MALGGEFTCVELHVAHALQSDLHLVHLVPDVRVKIVHLGLVELDVLHHAVRLRAEHRAGRALPQLHVRLPHLWRECKQKAN
eukprot:206067-Prorocentrum_minimum.AAC.1